MTINGGMRLKVFSVFFATIIWVSQGYAQVTTATISGAVVDNTGAVIPGASVTITNTDTGASRTVPTDAKGVYRVPQLPVGMYQVKIEMQGFQTAVRSGIKLTVGQEAVINLTLQVGAVTETVTVTGEAPVVETTTSTVGGLVGDQEIRALPLNGRDYTQLITLQAGTNPTINAGGAGSMRNGTGSGKRISVNGARVSANVYLIDGTEVADVHRQSPGSVTSGSLGIEAIREFSLLTNSYDASYSSQEGAIVNAVSRSGTNDLHGSVFEFLRNSVLDANDFFLNAAGKPKAPLKRNQFGFALGGPIVHDKTFFFGTLEGLRERLGVTTTARVPNANARNGFIPLDPNNPTQLTNVGVDSNIKPFLNLWPAVNGRDFKDGTGEHVDSFGQPTNDWYWMARGDHRFSDSDNLFVRYTYDKSTESFATTDALVARDDAKIFWQYATLEYNHVFSPAWINTARLGFTRNNQFFTTVPLFAPFPSSFDFIPGIPFGQSSDLGFDGGILTGVGGRSNYPKHYITNNYQYQDDILHTQGAHQLKFGTLVKRFQTNLDAPQNSGGTYTFASLQQFLQAKPRIFTGAVPGSDAHRSMRQTMVGFYVTDEYQMRAGLTLNLGLRYEMATVPSEKYNRLVNVRTELDPTSTQGPLWKATPQGWNFQPHIGFAWDPFGNGKTAVRGGFGIFRQYLLSNQFFITVVRQPPLFGIAVVSGPPFLGVFRTVQPSAGKPSLQSIDYDTNTPYVLQYNLSVQQEVLPSTSLTLTYAGSRGNHLLMIRNADTKYPTILPDGRACFNFLDAGGKPNPNCPNGGLTVRNPNFSHDARQSGWAQSFYNSFQVKLDRRFQAGLQLGVAYTFSKIIDEGFDRWDAVGNAGSGGGAGQDADNHKLERNLADYDIRNNLVTNFTYEIPSPNYQSAWIKEFLGNWMVNGILRFSNGNPFTATLGYNVSQNGDTSFNMRPNLKPGANNNPVLGGPDRYFDPTVFEQPALGFYGNVARNTIIGPGIADVGFSVVKNFSLGTEQRNLEFRAEFFNLFNHTDFGAPNGTVFSTSGGGINGTAGRIITTSIPSRVIQFGLKLSF